MMISENDLVKNGIDALESLKKGCEAFVSAYKHLSKLIGTEIAPFDIYLTEENLPDFLNKDEYLPGDSKICRLSFKFDKYGAGDQIHFSPSITSKTSPIVSKTTAEKIKNQGVDSKIHAVLIYIDAGRKLCNFMDEYKKLILESNDLVIEELIKIFAENSKDLDLEKFNIEWKKVYKEIKEENFVQFFVEAAFPVDGGDYLVSIRHNTSFMNPISTLLKITDQNENLLIFNRSI